MRYFLAVIDHGGITRAARELYISQPSLSQAIRTLETQFGASLFDRVGRELRPTAEGLALAESLRSVLALVDDAQERVKRVVDVRSGRLTIAAASTFAIHPLPVLLREFLNRYPEVQVHIRDTGSSAQALAELRSGSADVALVESPVDESAIISHLYLTEELFVGGTVGELSGFDDGVPADAIAKIPFGIVSRDRGGYTPTLRKISTLLGDIRATCADRTLLWELVQAGAVATFVPRRVAELMLPGIPLRSVEPPVIREIALAYREGYPSPASDAFVELALSLSEADRSKSTKAAATAESPSTP